MENVPPIATLIVGAEAVIPSEQYDVVHGYLLTSIYGDLNGDGIVNISDIFIVAKAFHSSPGDPDWNPIADINNDDWINIIDIWEVAKAYGKTA